MAHWKTAKRSKAKTMLRLADLGQSRNASVQTTERYLGCKQRLVSWAQSSNLSKLQRRAVC